MFSGASMAASPGTYAKVTFPDHALNFFYAMTIFGEPDILLGDITRKGPLCFCHGYRRYRQFTRPIVLADKLDAIVRTEDPKPTLLQVFGSKYSNKHRWP